jgi:hypothetical protein
MYVYYKPMANQNITATQPRIHPKLGGEIYIYMTQQRNILHEIRSKRKVKWIGHILRRNGLLQRVIKGKIQGGIEVTGRQGRRRMKLLDDLKEMRGHTHLKK